VGGKPGAIDPNVWFAANALPRGTDQASDVAAIGEVDGAVAAGVGEGVAGVEHIGIVEEHPSVAVGVLAPTRGNVAPQYSAMRSPKRNFTADRYPHTCLTAASLSSISGYGRVSHPAPTQSVSRRAEYSFTGDCRKASVVRLSHGGQIGDA